jgi:arsenate reductase (thioredoxin)
VSDVFRVLFLCTGNSARSQIAEALVNHDGAGRLVAESAGTEPAARVNPGAVEALASAGIEWHGHAPRSVVGLDQRPWDLVVTVCDDAKESCPVFPAGPVIAHWGMPDPAAVPGDVAAKRAAFHGALDVLRRRVEALMRLPVEDLSRPALEARVREIGGIG